MSNSGRRSVRPKQTPRYLGDYEVDLPTSGAGTDLPAAVDGSDLPAALDGSDIPGVGAETNPPVSRMGLADGADTLNGDTVIETTSGLTSYRHNSDTVMKPDSAVFSSAVTKKTDAISPVLVKCDSLVRRLDGHMCKAREMMTTKASRSVLQSLMKRMERCADDFKAAVDRLEPLLSSGDHVSVHRWYYCWLDGFEELQDKVLLHLESREEEPVSYAGSIAPTYASSHCSDGQEDRLSVGSSIEKSRLEQLEINVAVAAQKLQQERLRVLEENRRQENLRLRRQLDEVDQKRLEIQLNNLRLPASHPPLPSLPLPPETSLQQRARGSSRLPRAPPGIPSGASQPRLPLEGALPFGPSLQSVPAVADEKSRLRERSGSRSSDDYHYLFRHLAKPSLDVFDGDGDKYFQWREQFKLFVDETSVPVHVKMMLLKKCLKGRPLQMISTLGYTSTHYSLALRRLDQRFGGAKRAVQRHLREIFETDKVRENDLSGLENFVDCLQNIEASLLEQGHISELSSASALYCAVLLKMPEELVLKYRMSMDDGGSDTLSELIFWLQRYVTLKAEAIEVTRRGKQDKTSAAKKSARSHASVTSSSDTQVSRPLSEGKASPTNRKQKGKAKSPQSASNGSRSSSQKKTTSASDVVEDSQCVICEKTHALPNCSRWKGMTVSARWHAARAYNLCFRCLSGGHRGQACKRSNLCDVDSCPQTHHRDLHYVSKADSTKVTTPQPTSTSTPHAASTSTSTPQAASTSTQWLISSSAARQSKALRSVALRVLPVYVVGLKGKLLVNAFLDDGSDTSFVRKEIADALGCKSNEEQLSLSTLVENTNVTTSTVELGIENLTGNLSRNLRVKVLPKICPAVAVVDWNRHRKAWAHLQDLEFPKLPGTRSIDILIGSDYPELSLSLEERFGQPGEPVARLTPLGWTCIGRVSSLESGAVSCHAVVEDGTSEDLTTLLRRSWELDTLGIRKVSDTMSSDDRMVLERAEQGMRFVGDRYQVSIPWKQGHPSLPDNRSEAVKRLVSLEKSLHRRGSDMCARYQEAMQDNFRKGYFEELQEPSPGGWYLPHFAVVREDKTSTKIRIVFDGSSRFNGMSLNESMHAGPKLQNDILSVLVRFRFKSIAVVGDIKEMFSQIVVNPADRNYHRILWRNLDSKQPIQTYEAVRLPFGDRASPFLAQFVVKGHAENNSRLFPVGSLTCLQDMYVDDVITGASSVEAAIETRREVSKLLSSAGFIVRKWCSNNAEVMQDVPLEDRASGLELHDSGGSLASQKTLGVIWHVGDDNFSFQARCSLPVSTKRSLLSRIATIFDPLQFLAPFLIRARIIMQETWLRGLDWDEPLPDDLQTRMREWTEELTEVSSLCIPRFLCEVSHNTIFHTFVDASSLAFAAATYVADDGQSTSSCRLIAAKAHVAPLSATSIPRLELTAALVGLRLSVAVAKALGVDLNRFIFWTDSVNVLHWIHNHSRSFKPFVAHRIAEIQEHSEPSQWKYVPTTLNVADIATQGVRMEQIRQTAWLSGPEFISRPRDEWPSQPRISSSEEARAELKNTSGTVHMTSVSSDQTFSS